MITIYCTLLGLVIITLLLYVLFKLWKQHLLSKDAKGSVEDGTSGGLHPAFTELSKSRSASGGNSANNSLNKQKSGKARPVEGQHLLGEPQQYSSK